MKRFSFLLIALMVIPFYSLADSVKNGVLQAYWLPQWNDGLNKPIFQLRFFPFSDSGKQEKAINLDSSEVEEGFVRNNFNSYSNEFFKNKEGHIEQSGLIHLNKIKKSNECDSTVWQAKIISFKKNSNDFKIDEHNEECNSYPYLITYQLKEDVDSVALMDKPESEGKVIYRIDNQHSLVKVKSVNSEWVYVAEYDESKKDMPGEHQGYVEYREIEPLN